MIMKKLMIKILHKTNYIKIAAFFMVSILIIGFASSCKKNFLTDNTNPNNATANMLQYDNLGTGAFFVQMEENVFAVDVNTYQLQQNLIGDVYSGYMGASDNWNSNQNTTTYFMTPSWTGVVFTRAYSQVMSGWLQIKNISEVAHPDVYALAQIIKIEAMHRVTDVYGPVPYSQYGSASLTTPYDSQSSIYSSFFTELDAAISVLTDFVKFNPGVKPLAKYDLIYGGDYNAWIKFANSLKLRLAMHMVYADPTNAQKYAEAAVAGGVMTSNTDNALLKSANNIIINNPLETIWDGYSDIRMGANMESFLKGYNDPRIAAFFNMTTSTVPADYHGIRNGISISNLTPYRALSTLTVTNSTPIQWMVSAEMYFLRAEGAIRGWNMGGTPQSLYELGVQTAFKQAGVTIPATYLTDATSKAAAYTDVVTSGNSISTGLSTVTIKWNDADLFETKLERIITQKWISMYPDGQEAWTEFRRTRYPLIFPVKVNNSAGAINTTTQIRRIPFPSNEYQNNVYEVTKAVSLLNGPDNGGTKLWWDKKP
jgi:hypothetical protein